MLGFWTYRGSTLETLMSFSESSDILRKNAGNLCKMQTISSCFNHSISSYGMLLKKTHTHTQTKQKQKTLIYVAKCLFEKSVGIWLLWLFRTLKEEWKGIGPLPCPRRVSSQALSSQLGALLPQRGLNFFCISRLSLFLSWREGSSFLWFERGYGVAWSLEGTWFCIYWCGNDTDLDPGPPSIEID